MNEKISRKYRCIELLDMIANINDFARELMPLAGGGSLWEYADYFGLPQQEITLKGLVCFLKNRKCIKVNAKKNLVHLDHENLLQLHLTLRKELSKKRGRR
jgi:hypothetical protein